MIHLLRYLLLHLLIMSSVDRSFAESNFAVSLKCVTRLHCSTNFKEYINHVQVIVDCVHEDSSNLVFFDGRWHLFDRGGLSKLLTTAGILSSVIRSIFVGSIYFVGCIYLHIMTIFISFI